MKSVVTPSIDQRMGRLSTLEAPPRKPSTGLLHLVNRLVAGLAIESGASTGLPEICSTEAMSDCSEAPQVIDACRATYSRNWRRAAAFVRRQSFMNERSSSESC